MTEGLTLGRLDRQLMHGLRVDGRVSFRVLADVLGSSEQTVARRYRALREAGMVRVLVLPAPAPGLEWMARIEVVPGSAVKLARALAARDDVGWVSINSGGAEVLFSTRPQSSRQRDELLLDRLPQTKLVQGVVAHATLHRFAGAGVHEWAGFDDPLAPEQVAAIEAARALPHAAPGHGGAQQPEDQRLLAALRVDGRASYAALAAEIGSTPGRVRRRLETLLGSGAAYVDVDVAVGELGFQTTATLWMTVAPSRLDDVGRTLAEHPEIAHVAALSGPANMSATVVTRDTDHLYRYVSATLGSVEGIERVDVSPVMRRVKLADSLIEGGRLPLPA